MDNRVLFRDGPLRITCSGCGKEFYADEISRCRACGGYFCKECQKTHDCRVDSSGAHYVPSYLSPAVPQKSAGTGSASAAGDTSHSAPHPAVRSEKTPYKNTGMFLTDDEAYSAYVREVNPIITCESCGEQYPRSDMWICPDCGAVLCQICRQKHKCPKPDGQQNKLLALLPFTKEKKPAKSPACLPAASKTPERFPASGPAAYSAPPSAAVSQVSDIQYHKVQPQNQPAVQSAAEPAPAGGKMLTCGHCGKSYPISKMKKCHSCGAVLCPKCRLLHSCSPKKEKSSDEIKPEKSVSSIKTEIVQKIAAAKLLVQNRKAAAEKSSAQSADAAVSSQKKTASSKKEWDELILCDDCGKPYLKSNLRKCRVCGAVLCPKCRRKHNCGKKEE
ncbi:MAG TPA: hypothetical protein O0X42_02370 [Methanocorpusculum sp.]|nr:hypothetical protein [Methanocorpusculum sp.]